MFQRTPKSSPADERSPRADLGDVACLRVKHALEWRDAAGRVTSAYKAWCAAGRCDRHRLYISFVDALRREEQAARQLERDMSAPAAPIPSPRNP